MDEQWVLVLDWERFQHYRDRQPPWIKNYTELISDDDYRSLPLGTRGVLHGLWLEYARSRRVLRGDSLSVSRVLGQRVLTAQLEALEQAGFIRLLASKPDASDTRVRKEVEGLRPEEEELEKKELAPKPARRRDELWDALTEALGHEPATKTERGRRNKALKDLRAIGATPADIIDHAARFRHTWPALTLTETGLVAHWSRFSNGPRAGETPAERLHARMAERGVT